MVITEWGEKKGGGGERVGRGGSQDERTSKGVAVCWTENKLPVWLGAYLHHTQCMDL